MHTRIEVVKYNMTCNSGIYQNCTILVHTISMVVRYKVTTASALKTGKQFSSQKTHIIGSFVWSCLIMNHVFRHSVLACHVEIYLTTIVIFIYIKRDPLLNTRKVVNERSNNEAGFTFLTSNLFLLPLLSTLVVGTSSSTSIAAAIFSSELQNSQMPDHGGEALCPLFEQTRRLRCSKTIAL